MHPAPIWAVYRDAKTGRLLRKYVGTNGCSYSGTPAVNNNMMPPEIATVTATCSSDSL